MNPLKYPASGDTWRQDHFVNPPSEYRGAPLWCWNNKLKRDQLLRQIDHLADMGMGGFHIHSRVGLDTPYLGDEFMGHVKACMLTAKSKGLLACLYDEDRWPSGAAGGLVVADNPEFKAQHLLLTKREYGSFKLPPQLSNASGRARRSNLGSLLSRYDIDFDESGSFKAWHRLKEEEPSGPNTWFAYVEPNPNSEWFNSQTYVDTLNPEAIKSFIGSTYEKYHDVLAEEFGGTVPSIFTDEPQFAHKSRLARSTDDADMFLPWSLDLPATFKPQYGYDILGELPGIVWDVPVAANDRGIEGPTRAPRYHFHDHVCERFVTAFMDQVAGWCRERKIALIGHMMNEPTLLSQTQALGEAMRCYRNLDMPGVDMLCDALEYNTVKQATSVARQNGSRGVMSEIYGVTNWTFDFAGHKGSGDWQAALGITFRVHHLSWVSMAGEAKRDYPACIGYQSPWYKEYKHIEDHFSRVNVAMTRGRPRVRVGVIHPIESFWLTYGPMDSNAEEASHREQAFEALTSWLLFGLVDFDFISESLLPEQTSLESVQAKMPFPVGEARYEAIIVPNLKTIRSTTLERLKRFAAGGGTVLFAGSLPSVLDGAVPFNLDMSPFKAVSWTQFDILQALRPCRDVRIICKEDGSPGQDMMYQWRDDGDSAYLFVCNTHRKRYFPTEVGIRGKWLTTVLDTISGTSWMLESRCVGDWTWFDWHFEACGSCLLSLTPRKEVEVPESSSAVRQDVFREQWTTATRVSLSGVELAEPNVLVLDYASYSIGDGAWEEPEEILRIDNIVREKISLPLKGEAYRQPWAVSQEQRAPKTTLRLRYEIVSETAVSSPQLALEHIAGMEISLDGTAISTERSGWWVDEDISLIDIPRDLEPGRHVLEMTFPFGVLTNLERVYLLGQFAVEVRGRDCRLQKLDTSRIGFGNWAVQGLPFYAGNLTYICRFKSSVAQGEKSILHVPHFSAPVLAVWLDNNRVGTIALQPNVVDLGHLDPGRVYELRIVCYGNRENAFGTLHMPDGVSRWFAPNAWRTEHDWWMEGYNVKPMGVLDSLRIKGPGREIWKVPRNPERLWTCCD